MAGRAKAGGRATKAGRRKAKRLKRVTGPVVTSHARPSAINLRQRLNRRTRELELALEREAATAEVLKVISSSAGNLEPIFQIILEKATDLCGAKFGDIFRFDGNAFHFVARVGTPPKLEEFQRQRGPFQPISGGGMDRMMQTKQVVHTVDNTAAAVPTPAARLGGARSTLWVPMLKDDALIGGITVYRQEIRPFTDKQIELVQNFAAHAVIAIENARLLNELRQRTNDLSESLEQQTATSEVLKVISSSPGHLKPVFHAMLKQATQICEAKFGIVVRYEGGLFHPAATLDLPPALADFMVKQGAFAPRPGQLFGQLCESKTVINVVDRATDPEPSPSFRYGGARSSIAVPMLKDDELLGAFFIYRTEVRPFTDKQIELVKNFAAQAVIAIENTRLLSELRETLERQTATGEVLNVISRSPSDTAPVFETIVTSAARLCGATFCNVQLYDGELMHIGAAYNFSPESETMFRKMYPRRPDRDQIASRAILTGVPVYVRDLLEDPEYPRALAIAGGWRAIFAVPMLRNGKAIGVITVARSEPAAFSEQQVTLLNTFADQAVIAIENARVLNELRQRTHELATSLDTLRTTQDRLVQTQKLASLGQLTAGIAHEIKNPLNFVNNFSGISAELIDELRDALKDSGLDEKRREEVAELMGTLRSNLDKVVQHGKRADAIVKNMLLHSHQGSGEHRPVAINAIVEESLKLAYHGARAEKDNFNIMVEQSFDPVAGEADIFPQEITRVLLNLISNGVYAAKKKAPRDGEIYKPTLTASTKSLGDRVEIRIRDNGMGVPPEVKDKMFNPFFTTKPAGEGTGLGLSISHDIIVKQHGGSIEIDTKPGEFTEVRIVLPRTAASG